MPGGGAPLLLTTADSLPTSVKSVIQDAKPTKAIILGGTGSVSTNIETELQNLGITDITRISGADRYEVSSKIADIIPTADLGVDTAIITSGGDTSFGDSIVASSQAARRGMPILLVQQNSIPATIQDYINRHTEIQNFIIIGGPGSVSDSVMTSLQSMRLNGKVDRISGANRFEVAVNVINYFGDDGHSLSFANGLDFPDGLSVAPLAAYTESPTLLVQPDTIDTVVTNYLTSITGIFKYMYLAGGTASVSTNVENQLLGYIN